MAVWLGDLITSSPGSIWEWGCNLNDNSIRVVYSVDSCQGWDYRVVKHFNLIRYWPFHERLLGYSRIRIDTSINSKLFFLDLILHVKFNRAREEKKFGCASHVISHVKRRLDAISERAEGPIRDVSKG